MDIIGPWELPVQGFGTFLIEKYILVAISKQYSLSIFIKMEFLLLTGT